MNAPQEIIQLAEVQALRSLRPDDSPAGDPALEATDLANAHRLAEHHENELRHCRGLGWLVWDGKRWAADRGAAELIAQKVPGYVLADAAELTKRASMAGDKSTREELGGRAETLMRWTRASAQAPRIAAALSLAEPLLGVALESLDADPWALNTTTGTVDLRTGDLRPHRREDLITKLCRVPYDPAAAAPRFEALIAWAMRERPSLVSYLKRAAGYSTTGSAREQCLLFAYGGGANGKSTILGAIAETLGEDYAVMAMPDLLVAAAGERHATELAHLRGARMVLVNETEDGRRLAVQRMKMLTGERRITARSMRQDPFTFTVEATLWLQSNHRPEVAEQTRAVWRRIRVVPFEATVEHEDKHLPETLRTEQPGILRWLVEGAVEWQQHGLGMPPEVAAAVEDYRVASDGLGSFVADCCATGDHLVEPAAGLYSAYRSYCESEGTKPLDAKRFKNEMVCRGFTRQKRSSGFVYHGVAISLDDGSDGDA